MSGITGSIVLAACMILPAVSSADGILDVFERNEAPFNTRSVFFPNWQSAPTASFVIMECQDFLCAECTSSSIVSLTVQNFGTADHSDITNVYFALVCGSKHNTGLLPMTSAGMWTVGSSLRAAWTWDGTYLFASNADPCLEPNLGCSCEVSLFLYVDVGPCPTEGATLQLGLPPGALVDDCTYSGPPGVEFVDVKDSKVKELRYIVKTVDREEAVPGDTVEYRIYTANPGSAPTQTIVVDSTPLYTHYIPGSPVPALDADFPKYGSRVQLQWTLPAPAATAGGATSVVSFKATVDWGNDYDPQAGSSGAPEGARLWNFAQGFWPGSDCAAKTYVSLPVNCVVSRFLFWKIGDNDLLFAGDPDQREEDFMVYEIFIRNKSMTKTWWDVTFWDTVPEGLDPFWPGCGIHDDCVGFTMTPTGCARGAAGVVLTPESTTILTWKLDLPPDGTQTLRWRSRVRPTTSAGTMVQNQVAIRAYGRSYIENTGTGDSMIPAVFTHQAKVVLRTTYFSYSSFAVARELSIDGIQGFFTIFFPLNAGTNFQLYKLEYTGNAGIATTGGKSASINTLVASCDAMGTADGGGFSISGCGPSRRPAIYWPAIWDNVDIPMAFVFLYKIASNSPFLWMTMAELSGPDQDACTYVPSTTFSYRGFMHYTVCRVSQGDLTTAGMGDRLVVINTNMDSNNEVQSYLPTTIHFFKWSWANPQGWAYLKTVALDSEGAFMPFEGTYGAFNEDNSIYRIISSQSQNIIYQGSTCFGAPAHIVGAYNDFGAISPNRENGNLIAAPGEPASHYCLVHAGGTGLPDCVIGNVGSAEATYRIYQYMPHSTAVPDENWPTTLAGSSGYYIYRGTHTIPPGFTPGNPHLYGDAASGYDPALANSTGYLGLWKIEIVSGGPIQIHAGGNVGAYYGGASNLHASDGRNAGREFWFFTGKPQGTTCSPASDTYVINNFSPKKDVRVRLQSSEGHDWSYSTDGPDQAIAWMRFTTVNSPAAYVMSVDTSLGGEDGLLIAQFHQCCYTEKFLTAPFVETGIHYKIYAPAVAYSGQPFWMTVVVVGPGGGTQTDYDGTIDFTSSDTKSIFPFGVVDGYVFTGVDSGIHMFLGVSLGTLGSQTIIGSDTVDGSVTGLTSVMVVGAAVNLTKQPGLALAASGDTVEFKICWSNYSNATAFDLTITDAVPMGTNLLGGLIASDFICGVKEGVVVDVAYSTDTTPTVPAMFSYASPSVPQNARWLRWTVKDAGINASGCVCFKVSVF